MEIPVIPNKYMPEGVITCGVETSAKVKAELDRLTAERDRYKAVVERLNREAAFCDAHGITLQFVQFTLSKTAEALSPKEAP